MNKSMPKLYATNGTGRDTYISVNNGGFYPPLEKLHTQIPDVSWQYGSPQDKISNCKLQKRVFYQSDGTGRDTYVVQYKDNSAITYKIKCVFTLSSQANCAHTQNHTQLPNIHISYLHWRLSNIANSISIRAAQQLDWQFQKRRLRIEINLKMGNECSQLCQEPEITIRVSDFKTSPRESSTTDHLTTPQKFNYFQETASVIENMYSQKRERRAPYKYQTGAIYEGEWLAGMRDGQGTMLWADGARYEGEWKSNRANGKGKFWHVDSDTYEGEWLDDKANGYGVFIHLDGAKYEGYWKNDLQHGYGIETWTDGSKYEGFYQLGKKHGSGKYLWPDGSIYTGQWSDNAISGTGIYEWLDGRRYEGEWKDNFMHGKGHYTWKDGRSYIGEYQQDKKHGNGIYVWEDGRKYEGPWVNGKQHGKGLYSENGVSKMGIWEEGRRVQWID